jgi:hypothetical protein
MYERDGVEGLLVELVGACCYARFSNEIRFDFERRRPFVPWLYMGGRKEAITASSTWNPFCSLTWPSCFKLKPKIVVLYDLMGGQIH